MKTQATEGFINRTRSIMFNKVDVYVNLNSDFEGICYSVRSRETADYGTVVAHVKGGFMTDVDFAVQPAGWQRALESGAKNVHAFARGTMVHVGKGEQKLRMLRADMDHEVVPVRYDMTLGAFINADNGLPLRHAEHVAFTQDGVFAYHIEYRRVSSTPAYKYMQNK